MLINGFEIVKKIKIIFDKTITFVVKYAKDFVRKTLYYTALP